MSDPLHQADLSTGLTRWATGLGTLQAAMADAQAAILQALVPPYPHWSAQTTEAAIARQQAARRANPPVVDGDAVYRLMRQDATEGHVE